MRAAVLVIDMIKDNFEGTKGNRLTDEARAFLPALNHLLAVARKIKYPVIFASDSFLKEDFIFNSKLKPHAIRGTHGAEVINDIHRGSDDIIMGKRRFSAFFKTDLDQTLRTWRIDTVVVTGIATTFCILGTVFDALSHDFKTILIEDCTAAHDKKIHQIYMDIYRNSPLYPLLRVFQAEEFINMVNRQ
ncbi:cysteine hydrolase family protein [Desulfosarcina ovata]|nr:isochorismatase family cysteine hydrolase [Desulfosarcina ovata]